ncbi:reverse transcriptase domain-containing protein [Trichonephila clavipes]|nr:reverse transcriptase domain-containing protein [Trichonephila clavipes]
MAKALLWINDDFLRGRKFSVRFNGALSESRRMWAGVPQGSVLSPLLFLIFMNTIHHHIHPDTNIACYADDIAIWHSHNDITESEKALNTTLKGIAEWAENLKLTINADKTNYCIFSTDRRHRSSFNANIKIQNSQIKKSTFPPILEPVLEYATPIWTPASISVKRKLDSVQHRAAKIIIGAVSSTNNEKAEQECGLPPLESRRKLATIKFTNKLRSYGLDHISRRVFDKWKHSTRLKRSSTLQLDSEFRKELNLDHSSLEFLQEPLIPKNPPKNTCFEWNCCSHVPKKKTLSHKKWRDSPVILLPSLEQLHNKRKSCILQWIPAHVNIEGHEDSPRQDKIICSMQTLPRSSTDAQSHLGMPNRRNKVTKNGNGPSEGLFVELLYSPDAPRIAEAVIKTFDGI